MSSNFEIHNLAVVGLNFKSAPNVLRNRMHLNDDLKSELYAYASDNGIEICIILTTCNRLEVYCNRVDQRAVYQYWLKITATMPSAANDHIYVFEGEEAVRHLFAVTSGLDSQIIGDAQISSQVRLAFVEAKSKDLSFGLLDKLAHQAIFTSRRVKNETDIGTGCSSVASVVTSQVQKRYAENPNLKVCVIGLGSMGKLSCANLAKKIPAENIVIVNRSISKAIHFAQTKNIDVVGFEEKGLALNYSDVIIVATAAPTFVLHESDFTHNHPRVLFDLTQPSNLHESVQGVSGLTVFDLHDLSEEANLSKQLRTKSLPKAKQIIEEEVTAILNRWKARAMQIQRQKEPLAV